MVGIVAVGHFGVEVGMGYFFENFIIKGLLIIVEFINISLSLAVII